MRDFSIASTTGSDWPDNGMIFGVSEFRSTGLSMWAKWRMLAAALLAWHGWRPRSRSDWNRRKVAQLKERQMKSRLLHLADRPRQARHKIHPDIAHVNNDI